MIDLDFYGLTVRVDPIVPRDQIWMVDKKAYERYARQRDLLALLSDWQIVGDTMRTFIPEWKP